MDSSATGNIVRHLTTSGLGSFSQSSYQLPKLGPTDILVRAAMTGVCRSDIAMMQGEFQLLPESMHGHEGLGVVQSVGASVSDVEIGDYVATRGEPAYADYYVAATHTYVSVPELDPKYILEPVACGVNVVMDAYDEIISRVPNGRLCIIGTGFLARVVYQTLIDCPEFTGYSTLDIIGKSNKAYWGDKLISAPPNYAYDVVIDISETDTLQKVQLANSGLIVLAAAKQNKFATTFDEWLWKNITIKFPSPRSAKFYSSMIKARQLVQDNRINVSDIWSRGYNRDTEWTQAFLDAVNRTEGYNRGYIYWPDTEE